MWVWCSMSIKCCSNFSHFKFVLTFYLQPAYLTGDFPIDYEMKS